MIWTLGRIGLADIYPGWLQVDAGHILNYATFLISVLASFVVARKFVRPRTAAIVAVLFFSQPLLFGHAFVNEKDTPFMAFFSLAVALGMVAVDSLLDSPAGHADENPREQLKASFSLEVERLKRFTLDHPLLMWAILICLVGKVLLLAGLPTQAWIDMLVERAYQSESGSIVNWLFARVAENAGALPASAYAAKASVWLMRLRLVASSILGAVTFGLLGMTLSISLRPITNKPRVAALLIIIAGLATGLAISVRIAGPLAGVLVSLYILSSGRRWAIAPLVVYWFAAGVATVLTWPYLWTGPLSHFVQAAQVMANFETHLVLFNGQPLQSTSLPWTYLSTLLLFELTLPALLSFIWGSVKLAGKLAAGDLAAGKAAILVPWLGIPFLAVEIMRTPLYGNLRQALFIIPPIFIIGTFGIEDILRRVRSGWLAALILLIALLPSLVSLWRLHPYQFAYFNFLAGGPQKAAE